jgi:hypothetical protein
MLWLGVQVRLVGPCLPCRKFGSEFNSGCQVAKLFAKHFKIKEQITTLKKRVNIATGTPNR